MNGVKRYEFEVDDRYLCDCGNGSRIIPVAIDTGKYVLASDYDRDTQALRAEVERLSGECEGCPMAIAEDLRIERDALRAQVEAMRALLGEFRDFTDTLQWPQRLRDKIDAALQAKP